MKKYFLTGLAILLPIAITIAFISFLVNLLTHPFFNIVSSLVQELNFAQNGFLFLSHEKAVAYLTKIIILIFLFFGIVLLGMLTQWVLIRSFLSLWDKILHKIPVVNTVYKTTKELIKTIFSKDTAGFKQVVMAPFPHKGMYVLGLITGDSPATDGTKLISILVPTTPNPTSGFLLMYKQEDLIYLDMRPEDAIKYVLSCGVIAPEERKSLP